MQTRIYVVRHGQTKYNLEKKRQGWKDSPLTEKGKRQAAAIRQWLQSQEIDLKAGYASDLGRAVQTLQIIGGQELPLYTARALREISYGSLDGTRRPMPDLDAWDEGAAYDYGGETSLDVWSRLYPFLLQSAQENPDSSLLMVSHSYNMVLLCSLLPRLQSFEMPRNIDNGTILQLVYSSGKLWLEKAWHPDRIMEMV